MKIGIVGYQGAGKSTLFEWLSGVPSDPSLAHQGQIAMAAVPDPRVKPLCEIYQPKKVTLGSLELVDTPGLSRDRQGNAARLAQIREAGCLVVVVDAYSKSNPQADIAQFDDDLLLADLTIVSGRIDRLRESVKKPRPNRDQELAELQALEPLANLLESGNPIAQATLTDEQARAIRSFNLLTEKPRLFIFNLADDDHDPDRWLESTAGQSSAAKSQALAIPIGLQLELTRMDQQDRDDFVQEMGLVRINSGDVLKSILETSGRILFFTTGDKEVRTWLIHRGGTALEAAANIHTDIARGFIRAEVMPSADLIRLGSEREMKAHHLVRQEHKDYVVQEGDVLLMKFNI